MDGFRLDTDMDMDLDLNRHGGGMERENNEMNGKQADWVAWILDL